MDSSRQIEERAAAWLAKRDSGHWSEADERALQTWLEESTANMVEFIRLETVWAETRRLKALGAGVKPGIVPPPNAWQLSPFFERSDNSPGRTARRERSRRFRPRATLAACLALVLAGTIGWYFTTAGAYYRTPVGGLASIPMMDGSKITLNTDSAVRLSVTEQERSVRLEQGEAFFEVAKDPTRPFIVRVGNKRVTAVGTKFSVRKDADNVRVLVTEGEVKFEDASLASWSDVAETSERAGAHAWSGSPGANVAAAGRDALFLTAGSVARGGESGVIVQARPIEEVEADLSWRSGFLSFNEIPLAEAVAEFNRYNDRKIVIRDPQVAAIRVTGKFRSTRFEAFVRLLEDGLQVRAHREEQQIILTGAAEPVRAEIQAPH